MPSRTSLAVALALCLAAPAVSAEEQLDRAASIRANYTKFEYLVPMRDGVSLFTTVYVPNHLTEAAPILLFRTPYGIGPYGADRYRGRLGPSEPYEREGFIFAFQDVRGKYMSEGEFVNMRPHIADKKSADDVDESTDTWDTVDWLVANIEGNNGRVGQWGISYPGFYAAAGAIDSHPALVAVSPQAPIADWYWDDMHHNGALILPLSFNFFSSFGVPRPEPTTGRNGGRFDHGTPDGYRFFLELGPLRNVNDRHFHGEIPFWNDITEHPDYDEFWQSRNILPHLRGITASVLVVGGWYDTEDLYGPLRIYREIERNNPEIDNRLVMGPWTHGGWNRNDGDALGPVTFGFKTSLDYRANVELPFFRHLLKDGDPPDLPEALVFETGANRWREFEAWPPPHRRIERLHFRARGELASDPPAADSPAYDDYVSDPDRPVPYTMEVTAGWARKYMTEDQRFAAWRPDVLVYESEPLEADLTIAGPIEADLWVSTSGTDSDWIVKVIDVFPGDVSDDDDDGPDLGHYQRLVRAEVFRGRYRESFEHPRPFVPDQPTQVAFELLDVLHTFKRGHRIMVQVQSTWFPFVDRNPQTYVENIFEATDEDFVPVTNRVYRDSMHPSGIVIGVID